MKIDKELVKKIAKLARLNLTDKEIEKFTPQLKEILDAFSKLDEVDTRNTKPSFHPIELKNFMREDKVKPSFDKDLVLNLTEHKKNGYFKGPKVV